jgi:hypothetical protein
MTLARQEVPLTTTSKVDIGLVLGLSLSLGIAIIIILVRETYHHYISPIDHRLCLLYGLAMLG